MTEYFAAKMTNAAIEAIGYGVRDLRNRDLQPFYDGPTVPPSAVADGVAAALEISAAAGTTAVTTDTYVDQAGAPNPRFFVEYLEGAGIEQVFTPDLFETADAARQPQSEFLAGFIEERGGAVSIPAVAASVAPTSTVTATVQHLTVPDLLPIADADQYVRPKIKNMRQYINRYLKPR